MYPPPPPKSWKHHSGFTLAELLITLAILGVIATFTIPKIVSAQQNEQNRAVVKETASMFAAAYHQHLQNGLVNANTTMSDLYLHLNYVNTDTSSTIDGLQTLGTASCASAGRICLKLHNGAMVYPSIGYFGGTNTTNALTFIVDPDGRVTNGTTNGPGKSIQLFIYYNGRITTYGTIAAGTSINGSTITATPAYDPPWFSW